ncbi:diaminopimelate decarboxylase [Helicobacter cappadocius]|uniref:Diaminopimelate decarboxylase n=1 Tax=Helicobacter cappadocius TaxID=3063998 RepID=A0AA90PIJ8_9HELI|nr:MULTISPECIES: diaminopimelate decarboxylase [unclassified Helicobacter]MDO7252619.1 diaminopimelate decarboxylase [Helicobacter sp. faydin-H75]MDP2538486.1 diaminopimelate decarboxylase [Helicobacter sp. faydin-H76]
MDFLTLSDKYKTPLYVYDLDKVKNQFLNFKEAFSGRKSLICYALKANSNLSLINTLAKLDSGADCVSIGEVRRAILAGIKKYKIIFSGVGKSDEEITEALELDILFINVESEQELQRVESIAQGMGKTARISIRVNPNIDAKTHPYISTGLHENKFGVDTQTASRLYLYAKKSSFLDPIGIHFHLGSQLSDLEPISVAAQKIVEFARSLLALKIDLKFFDVGGGIGIVYEDEKTIKLYDYAQAILNALKGLDFTVICEPGRYIVGESGFLVTKVLYEKYTDKKRFIIIDGAMNDLIRPSLYGAIHKLSVYSKDKLDNTKQSIADVVGPICESGDYLAKDVLLPPLSPGDLIVFENAGAYGYSMASNYNTRRRPAEVGLENGKDRILKRREKFENMVADELRILKGDMNGFE